MQVYRKYYSRGNLGMAPFQHEFLDEVADYVSDLMKEGYDFEDIIDEVYKEFKFKRGQGVEYDKATNEIVIYDKNYEIDPRTGAVNASWGYDEIRLYFRDWSDEIEEDKADLKNKISSMPYEYFEIQVHGIYVLDVIENDYNEMILSKQKVLELIDDVYETTEAWRNSAFENAENPNEDPNIEIEWEEEKEDNSIHIIITNGFEETSQNPYYPSYETEDLWIIPYKNDDIEELAEDGMVIR